MKSFAVLLFGLGLAVTAWAEPTAPVKSGSKAPASTVSKKPEPPPPTIDGITIPRGDHGFIGVRIVEGVFRLTFYDAKKKPKPPDVSRAALRWNAKYRTLDERTVLLPGGDANSLTSEKIVRPPFTFKLFVTLLTDVPGAEPTAETYPVDFRQ